MKAIICLAGGIATGKTTVADVLQDALPGSVVRSFGDVVRRLAEAEGLPPERAILQELGLRLITQGWTTFVDALLENLPQADTVIIDGVRHVDAVHEVRRQLPKTPIHLILLTADRTTVIGRLAARGEPAEILHHITEREMASVAAGADLEIDTTTLPEEIVSRILRSIR